MSSRLLALLFASRRRHTIFSRDGSSDVCSSDLSVGKVAKLETRLFDVLEAGWQLAARIRVAFRNPGDLTQTGVVAVADAIAAHGAVVDEGRDSRESIRNVPGKPPLEVADVVVTTGLVREANAPVARVATMTRVLDTLWAGGHDLDAAPVFRLVAVADFHRVPRAIFDPTEQPGIADAI